MPEPKLPVYEEFDVFLEVTEVERERVDVFDVAR